MPEKEPTSKKRIMEEAWQLLALGGLNALSMRKLASKVGVKASTLYWHFPSKEDLLYALSDQVAADALKEFKTNPNWKKELLANGMAFADALRSYPYSAEILISLPPNSQNFLILNDRFLESIDKLPLSDQEKFYAVSIYQNYILSFERDYLVQTHSSSDSRLTGDFLTQVPILNRIYQQGLFQNMNSHEMLEWSLKAIIEGIESKSEEL